MKFNGSVRKVTLPTFVTFITVALASCAQLPAPGSDPISQPAYTENRIDGYVFLKDPIVNAAIKITDLNGQVLATTTSNMNGSFSASIPLNVTNITITADGGQINSIATNTHLRSEIRDITYKKTIAPVNVVTTLTSAYLNRNPSVGISYAETQIRDFLEIPSNVNFAEELKAKYFDDEKFLGEAGGYSGIDSYILKVLSRITPGNHQSFKNHLINDDVESSLIKTIGKGLLDGATGELGGDVLGLALSAIGLGNNNNDAQFKEEMSKLDSISDQITNLENEVSDINKKLNTIGYYSTYNVKLSKLIADLETTKTMLANAYKFPTKNPKADQQDIIDFIKGNLLNSMEVFNNAIVGSPDPADSLIARYSVVVGDAHPEVHNLEAATAIQAQWDLLDYYQSLAALYIANYKQTIGKSSAELENDWQTWHDRRKNQLALVKGGTRATDLFIGRVNGAEVEESTPMLYLPDNTAVTKKDSIMWSLKGRIPRKASEMTTNVPDFGYFSFPDLDPAYLTAISEVTSENSLSGWAAPLDRWHYPKLDGYPDGLTALQVLGADVKDDEGILDQELVHIVWSGLIRSRSNCPTSIIRESYYMPGIQAKNAHFVFMYPLQQRSISHFKGTDECFGFKTEASEGYQNAKVTGYQYNPNILLKYYLSRPTEKLWW